MGMGEESHTVSAFIMNYNQITRSNKIGTTIPVKPSSRHDKFATRS